jgi:hypothetical protein
VQHKVSRKPMTPEEWAAQYCGREEDEATKLPGRQA